MELVRTVLRATPHLLTYALIGLALCVVLSPVAARVLQTFKAAAALPLLALAAVALMTLTPSVDGGFSTGAHACGTLVSAPLLPSDLVTHTTLRSLNVALFVPLGASVFLASGAIRRVAFGAFVVVLPAAVELVQYEWTALGRTCGLTDVVDNLTGAFYGLIVGAMAAMVLNRPHARRKHRTAGGGAGPIASAPR